MSPNSKLLAGLPGLLVTTALLIAAPSLSAAAAHGASTPGTTVAAVNPAAAMAGGGIHVALNAHAESSTVENPSCRPQDATLDCWGNLILRIPDAGGLSVSGFEVHRVEVGDDSCGEEHDDGCGDHSTTAADGVGLPLQAVVTGVAVLRNPGSIGEPRGSMVQLKIHLTDNSDALNTDQIDVQINKFVPGDVKPELYRSGPETIQQVRIHLKN